MPEVDTPATDFVLQGDLPLMEAQAALDAAEAADDGHAHGRAHLALEDAGAFDAKARAQACMLGWAKLQLDAPVNSFSGGWRMRLQLARALMCPPAAAGRAHQPPGPGRPGLAGSLAAALRRHPDRHQPRPRVPGRHHQRHAAPRRGQADPLRRQLHPLRGNARRAHGAAGRGLRQAAGPIAHLQKFIDRFKAKASKAKQAQSRVKALARMEKLAPVLAAADFSFEFREPQPAAQPHAGDGDVGLWLRRRQRAAATSPSCTGINRSVLAGQRIGILGANGQGKSTWSRPSPAPTRRWPAR
jgi:ATP-binding cassette subfamily F protein 3